MHWYQQLGGGITIFPPSHKEQHHRTFPQTNAETTDTRQGDSPSTSPTAKEFVSSPRQGRTLQRRSTSPLSQLRGTSRSSTLLAETRASSSRNTSRDGPARHSPPCIVVWVCGELANGGTTVAPDERPGIEHGQEGDARRPVTTVGCAVCWETDIISFYPDDVLVGERKSRKLRKKVYPVVGFLKGPVTVKIDLNSNMYHVVFRRKSDGLKGTLFFFSFFLFRFLVTGCHREQYVKLLVSLKPWHSGK